MTESPGYRLRRLFNEYFGTNIENADTLDVFRQMGDVLERHLAKRVTIENAHTELKKSETETP